MKALILIAEGFEDLSLFVPWFRLREEGAIVHVAAPTMATVTGQRGHRVEPDLTIHEVNPTDYDLLLIPDGRSPETLRLLEEAVDVTRTFASEPTVIATVGHGPQLLLSAGVLDGKTVTCSPGIRDDVRAAGAAYLDEGLAVDGSLLTCRGADDLPTLCRAMLRRVRELTPAVA